MKEYALKDPKGFLMHFDRPLFIDEIEKAPNLLECIKLEIDEMKFEILKKNLGISLLYILSWSNEFEVEDENIESLAGRTCIFNMSSLSNNEIKGKNLNLSFNYGSKENCVYYIKKNYEDIFLGGMPQYVVEKVDRNLFFNSYIKNFINKDVNKIINPNENNKFINFMKYLAKNSASILDYDIFKKK